MKNEIKNRHVIVIPNYHKSMMDGTSQLHVQGLYIDQLIDMADDVTVLLPQWGDDIIAAWKTIGFDFEDNYFNLSVGGNSYHPVLPSAYINYLANRSNFNNEVIYNFQPEITVDIMAELHKPPYQFPKVINHFVTLAQDVQKHSARAYKMYTSLDLAPTIYNSQHAQKQMTEIKPIFGMKSKQKASVGIGIETDRIRKAVDGVEKNEKFTILYPGNTISPVKNLDWIFDVLDKFYEAGRDFEFVMNLVSYSKAKAPNRPYITINDSKPQEDFWRDGAKAHCFISASKHESYGLAYWELSEAGCVGVFKNEGWLNNLAYANGFDIEPPFVVGSKNDAYAALSVMYDDYEKWQEKYDKMWDGHTFDREKCIESYKETVTNITNQICV